jgi:hypothetical protein
VACHLNQKREWLGVEREERVIISFGVVLPSNSVRVRIRVGVCKMRVVVNDVVCCLCFRFVLFG